MKNIFFLLIIAIFTLSCDKEDSQSTSEEEVKVKELNVSIELPINSSINPDDLSVSTILTDKAPVVDSNTTIETFDDEAIELAFATNAQGNIVLMGYFDPIDVEAVQLNLDNTAIALVMMHPWTIDLSVSAKKDAFIYIKNLPEYATLKQAIESSINAGEINPLATSNVIQKLILTQKEVFSRISEYKEPLHFDIEASKITVKNEVSSAAYSIGLYDPNNKLIEKKLVDGLGKLQYTMNQFSDNTFTSTKIPEITFDTPTANGNYKLKAKSGLSFDNSPENLEAAYENSKILLSNVVGIFSTKLKAIVRLKAGKCGGEIGAYVFNGTSGTMSIANSLKDFSQNNKTKYGLVKDVFFFSKDKYDGIVKLINSCSSNYYNIKSSPFKSFFSYLDILSNLESAFNGGAHLADWLQFDKSIETCFKKANNDISPCNLLSGVWTLDLTLGAGNCDETLLEDESGVSPTLSFNANGTVTFVTDPVMSGLNSSEFTNLYDLNDEIYLKIGSTYSDGVDNIYFQCNLTYNSQTQKFTGTYTNQWTDGTICTNNITMYK